MLTSESGAVSKYDDQDSGGASDQSSSTFSDSDNSLSELGSLDGGWTLTTSLDYGMGWTLLPGSEQTSSFNFSISNGFIPGAFVSAASDQGGVASPFPSPGGGPISGDGGAVMGNTAGVPGAGTGPNGATPAQVREAINAIGLNVNGLGIRVGVLSDSFNNLGGAATDESDGALPSAANIDIVKDGSGGSDEGRAMMQVVHDIASGSQLAFYTAADSEADFAAGILALAQAGCKVICDDYDYFDEPLFQTGVVANAIDTVEREGVIFVTMAFNNGENGYQANWNPIANTTFDSVALHDTQNFGGGSAIETITVSGTTTFVVQWNQPFGSATSDLEVVVFSGGNELFTVTNTDSGESGNPDISFFVDAGTYQVAIENLSGPDPGVIKEISEDDGAEPNDISVANAGTVQGHHFDPNAITVGAVDSVDTPGLGGTLQSEPFSSSGLNTQLWFNYNGTLVPNAPITLSPVAVSGVDDVSTSLPNDLSDFFGTSCATPTVAAVVADMLQADPTLPLAQIRQILEVTAASFGNSAVAGAGLVNAAAAVNIALERGAPDDFNANGISGILLADGGTLGDWLINNAAFAGGSGIAALPAGYSVVGVGEFKGNGTADLLLRNGSSLGDWFIHNGALSGGGGLASLPAGWNLIGTGDFNGDGTTDLLLQSGASLVDWTINNNTVQHAFSINTLPAGWNVIGTGDFNGDGTTDLLLQAGNYLVDWTIRNGTFATGSIIGQLPSGWSVAGTGDFNGDGTTDVLLQSGAVLVDWTVQNGVAQHAYNVGTLPAGWSVVGIGDYTGNGTDDLLLQVGTQTAILTMHNGVSLSGFSLPTLPAGWAPTMNAKGLVT